MIIQVYVPVQGNSFNVATTYGWIFKGYGQISLFILFWEINLTEIYKKV